MDGFALPAPVRPQGQADDMERRLGQKINGMCDRIWEKLAQLEEHVAFLQTEVKQSSEVPALSDAHKEQVEELRLQLENQADSVKRCDQSMKDQGELLLEEIQNAHTARELLRQSREEDSARLDKLESVVADSSRYDTLEAVVAARCDTLETAVAETREAALHLNEMMESIAAKLDSRCSDLELELRRGAEALAQLLGEHEQQLGSIGQDLARATAERAELAQQLTTTGRDGKELEQLVRKYHQQDQEEVQRIAQSLRQELSLQQLTAESASRSLQEMSLRMRSMEESALSQVQRLAAEATARSEADHALERCLREHFQERQLHEQQLWTEANKKLGVDISRLEREMLKSTSALEHRLGGVEHSASDCKRRIDESLTRQERAEERQAALEHQRATLEQEHSLHLRRLDERCVEEIPKQLEAHGTQLRRLNDCCNKEILKQLEAQGQQLRRLGERCIEEIPKKLEVHSKQLRRLEEEIPQRHEALEQQLRRLNEHCAGEMSRQIQAQDVQLRRLDERVADIPRHLEARLEDMRASAKEDLMASAVNSFHGEVKLWASMAQLGRGAAGCNGLAVGGGARAPALPPLA